LQNSKLYIDVTLNKTKSQEEKIWIRYTKDNWNTSYITEALNNISNNVYRTNEISISMDETLTFYVFTTLNLTSPPDDSDIDLFAINYDNNNGLNYSYTLSPLSGNYYIPTKNESQGFDNLTDAINCLNNYGINGTVHFYLNNDTLIQNGSLYINREDLSFENRLIIKPKNLLNATIIFRNLNEETKSAFVFGNESNHITIDGNSSENGAAKDLTILLEDNVNGHSFFYFVNSSCYHTIKNCILKYAYIPYNSIQGSIYARDKTSASNNITIQNCIIGDSTISNKYGIYFKSNYNNSFSNIVIENNAIYSTEACIYIENLGENNSLNKISKNKLFANGANAAYGISLQNIKNCILLIEKNYIQQISISDQEYGELFGIFLRNYLTNQTADINIFNNIIGGNFNSTANSSLVNLLFLYNFNNFYNINIYNNTLILNEIDSSPEIDAEFSIISCYDCSSIINLKNNILYNFDKNAVSFNIIATENILNFDYNIFYYSDLNNDAYIFKNYIESTSYKTLDEWKQISNLDLNSFFINISFANPDNLDYHHSDLHKGDLNLLASPIAEITEDIDGEARHNLYPYRGADKLSLPASVQLIEFNANFASNKAILKWKTAAEINNYGWDIERKKIDNNSNATYKWQKIEFVKGKGNSVSINEYNFIDRSIENGFLYLYRLKQIDNNGFVSYSSEISITTDNKTSRARLEIYPNSFNPKTTIRYYLPESSKIKIKLYDMIGKAIKTIVDDYQEAGIYEKNIDATELSSGVYTIVLETGNNIISKKLKLIK